MDLYGFHPMAGESAARDTAGAVTVAVKRGDSHRQPTSPKAKRSTTGAARAAPTRAGRTYSEAAKAGNAADWTRGTAASAA